MNEKPDLDEKMEYPNGFKDLVALMKKYPLEKKTGKDIWKAYWKVVFIGKSRSEAEINFLGNMLKKYIDYDYVSKTNGEDWQEEVEKFLKERLPRIRDENIIDAIDETLKGLFWTMASLKGGARFFEKKKIFDELDKLTADEDKTWGLIDEIIEDGDVSGIKYAKAILWLHYTGRGQDCAPPTRQLKSFLNSDVGPYYSYYEDNEYFMDRADKMKKDFKADLIDIYRAIYFYRTYKSLLPRGSKFTPKKLIAFMKKEKLTPIKLSENMGDLEKREKLAEKLFKFLGFSF